MDYLPLLRASTKIDENPSRESFMFEDSHSDRLRYASDRFRPPSGHEDVDTALKAAEALFAPKRPIADSTPNATGSTQQNARKPRILSAVREQQPQAAAHVESPRLKHETRRPRKRVPVSHLARARTWLKYGMTIGQAADIYGVSESEIERILQKA